MELKTLKDLKYKEVTKLEIGREGLGYEALICKSDLKAEAVKWIKEIDNFDKTPDDKLWEELTGNTIVYSEEGKATLRNFIKYFFNLSEEDLKDAEKRRSEE